jgi:hypothetical protein
LQHTPRLCVECSLKNTECFSQEYVSLPSNNDKRNNLRNRVSKLEAQIEAILKERNETQTLRIKDPKTESRSTVVYTPTSPSQNIVTLIESSDHPTSIISRHNTSPFHSSGDLYDGSDQQGFTHTLFAEIAILSNPATKDVRLRQILMSLLPQGDSFSQSLLKHNTYWTERNQRTPGFGRQFSSFADFAAYAFSRGSIYEVAEVAQYISFGENYPTYDKIISFIERFILSDEAYMSNLQGLNVGIVHRYLQNDRGEVGRSWQIARQCIGYAQAIGLHKYHINKESTKLWLGLYCVDRMLSLILGRPHGVSDTHCTTLIDSISCREGATCQHGSFTMKLCQISGRVIDHIQNFSDPFWQSAYELVQLEQELDLLASRMPPEIRPGGGESVTDSKSNGNLLMKFCSLLTLYGTYLSLHIPYMLRSIQVPRFRFIRDRCIQTARSYALNYIEYSLQTRSLCWQTRAFDSYAYAAAIILVLGIHGYGKADYTTDFIQNTADIDIVDKLMNVLNDISERVARDTIKRQNVTMTRFIQSYTQDKYGFHEGVSVNSIASFVEFTGVNSVDGLLEAAGKIATPNTPIETRYQDLPDLETWNSVLL